MSPRVAGRGGARSGLSPGKLRRNGGRGAAHSDVVKLAHVPAESDDARNGLVMGVKMCAVAGRTSAMSQYFVTFLSPKS